MKIGHFHYGIYRPGGICTYLSAITQAEISQGHQVVLFQTDLPDNTAGKITPNQVANARELVTAARDFKLDVLHMHATLFDAIPPGLPIVYTVHTNAPHCPGGTLYLARSQGPCPRSYSLAGCLVSHFTEHCGSLRPEKMLEGFRRRQLESSILPRLKIIAISHFIKEKMVASGYRADNIDVLHNFVLPSASSTVETPPVNIPPVFVYCGRLQPNKGAQWLIRAFSQTAGPSKLIIAGSGTMEQELKHLASRVGIAGRIEFTGWLTESDLQNVIRESTAVVVPSLWPEPFGLVALEASAAAKPVIASSAGGLTEIVKHGKTGLLVNPGDDAGLSAAIDHLAANPGVARRMGVEGKRWVEAEFSLHKHLNRLHEIYLETINQSGGTGFGTIPAP